MKRDNAHRRPLALDLFAGAGGLSLGFEQAGFDVVGAVEVDPVHAAVHHFNFPMSTAICRSVVDLTAAEIRRLANLGTQDLDVVCGGAPCQGFSTIGKRAIDDPRNLLVRHFCRLVGELRPRYVVFENVKGLTMGLHRAFLDEIASTISAFGYKVLTPIRVLNAMEHGVPQDRKRLFLIAARAGEQVPRYPETGIGVTVAEALSDLPDVDGFDELFKSDAIEVRLGQRSDYAQRLRGELRDPDDYGYPRRWNPRLLTSSTRTAHTELSARRFATTAAGKTEPVSRFLKLDPGGVCNTLRAGTDSARGAFTSPRPIHPWWPRVITVREAARLHSYPDWFRFHVTKWHGFRQIGNSVPPLLARAVAGQLIKAMRLAPVKPGEALELGQPAALHFTMIEAVRHFGLCASPIANRLRPAPQLDPALVQPSLDLGGVPSHV